MSETKESFTIHHGDCLEVLRSLPDCSVDSVVSDPPYGLSFMGKKWDYDVPSVEVWRECLRVLKPGGHLLAFAGTRTQHRMAVRIEDAGFEIRDMIAWVYGSGFPKSLDVSKAIDKAAGAKRKVIGYSQGRSASIHGGGQSVGLPDPITAPATEAARQWQGWGTALKPALEPITLARKPLEGTVAENVLAHGTGAINVDGCRVGTETTVTVRNGNSGVHGRYGLDSRVFTRENPPGRWPANLIHDGSEEVTELFPQTRPAKSGGKGGADPGMWSGKRQVDRGGHDDAGGSAARFFKCCPSDSEPSRFAYVPKASKKDRDEGNGHPTVKPTDLMRYLCRLVTCPGGVVLDPFTGSGSTGKAAVLEGFRFIGIEREAEYVQIARARISAVQQEKPEPDLLLI